MSSLSDTQQRQALSAAAQWYARLGSAPGNPQMQREWDAWHALSPANQWAWQRVQAMQAQLQGLPGKLAYSAFEQANRQATPLDRRTLLKGLVIGAGSGVLAWSGYRNAPVWLADQRTRTGERRVLQLQDGTRLTLNTASAVDILFTAELRLVRLHAGEILLETGKDPRPLIVRSAQGDMRALGTRFTVRQHEHHSELNVLEHAVAVRNAPEHAELRVEAGQTLSFGPGPLPAPQPSEPNQAQWSQGRLVIDGWRLDHLLAELQRYRPGLLSCAPEVAHLRVSGAYPLDDTDRALAALTRALPVRLESRTRYWVRVLPKG